VAAFVASAVLALYGYLDYSGRRFLNNIYLRAGLLVILALLTASVATIQNTIADAQKLEYRGPYVTQEIYVNRYLADLNIRTLTYNFSKMDVKASDIPEIFKG
jgi:hypothetical protein